MPQSPSPSAPDRPPAPGDAPGLAPGQASAAPPAASGASAEVHHPVDPAHDLSDSPIHARSPEAYTEEPGSHRRDGDGPALDVGA